MWQSVFFRKLDAQTTEMTMRALLEKHGPLDYCYVGECLALLNFYATS